MHLFFSSPVPSTSPIEDRWVTFRTLNGLCKTAPNIKDHKNTSGTFLMLALDFSMENGTKAQIKH